jgi:hypothetical protein
LKVPAQYPFGWLRQRLDIEDDAFAIRDGVLLAGP